MDRFDRDERAGTHAHRNIQRKLPPEVNRILYVRQLPYKISAEELYDIFGKFGAIRQIRQGTSFAHNSRGRAFVVYEDIYNAKEAMEALSGFNVGGRYISVTYHRADKLEQFKGPSQAEKNKEKSAALDKLQSKLGV